MSICTDVGSFIESKTTVVQTSNIGFTSEVSDYLVVHTGPDALHLPICRDVPRALVKQYYSTRQVLLYNNVSKFTVLTILLPKESHCDVKVSPFPKRQKWSRELSDHGSTLLFIGASPILPDRGSTNVLISEQHGAYQRKGRGGRGGYFLQTTAVNFQHLGFCFRAIAPVCHKGYTVRARSWLEHRLLVHSLLPLPTYWPKKICLFCGVKRTRK